MNLLGHRYYLKLLKRSHTAKSSYSLIKISCFPGLSTEYALAVLLDDIRKNIDKSDLVEAVFVDFRKAFNILSHTVLLDKLPEYGIKDSGLELFISRVEAIEHSSIVKYANDNVLYMAGKELQ